MRAMRFLFCACSVVAVVSGLNEEFDLEKLWDGLLDTPEVQELLSDPVKLKEAITENPLLKAIPGIDAQIEQVLESDAFKDPAKLKEAMKVGMDAFKSVGQEFTKELGAQVDQLLKDPEGFSKMMADTLSNMDDSLKDLLPGMEDLTPEQIQAQLKQAQDILMGGGIDDVEILPDGAAKKKLNARA